VNLPERVRICRNLRLRVYDAQPSHRVYPSLWNSTAPPCTRSSPRPHLLWRPGSLADRAWLCT